MTTSPIETPDPAEQLLRAVERLPTQELENFVERVIMLRAQRATHRLSHQETQLLLRINQPFPAPLQRRYDQLVAKRRQGLLNPAELRELIQVTDQSEQHDVARLAALIELAQERGVTVSALMATLGIAARPDV